jgi:hypothetical protein
MSHYNALPATQQGESIADCTARASIPWASWPHPAIHVMLSMRCSGSPASVRTMFHDCKGRHGPTAKRAPTSRASLGTGRSSQDCSSALQQQQCSYYLLPLCYCQCTRTKDAMTGSCCYRFTGLSESRKGSQDAGTRFSTIFFHSHRGFHRAGAL